MLQPRDREWNPHATYHLEGQYHNKSYGIALGVQQRQRLEHFKGTEHLGLFMGHGSPLPKCNPSDYTDVIRVPAGVLTGLKGGVMLDLIEPGVAPNPVYRELHEVIQEKIYKDCTPWLVMAVVVPRAVRIDSTNFVTGCLISDVTGLVMASQISFPFHLEDQLLDAFLAPHFKSTLERAQVYVFDRYRRKGLVLRDEACIVAGVRAWRREAVQRLMCEMKNPTQDCNAIAYHYRSNLKPHGSLPPPASD